MEITRKAAERRSVKVLLRRQSKVAFSSNLTCSPWRSSNAIITVLKRCSLWCNSFSTVTWIPVNVISSVLLHNGEIWTASLQPQPHVTALWKEETKGKWMSCTNHLLLIISPHSSVTKVNGSRLCERCSVSGRDRDLSLRLYVQTGSRVLLSSGYRGSFLDVARSWPLA